MMKPGFSLMDWNNLARVSDLARGQHSSTRQMTMDDVRRHKEWCVIRGKVYDFSQYVAYHPGGADELERGAGDDCTALFDEYHPWVNVEAMFKKCQVGILVDPTHVWSRIKATSVEDLGGHLFRVRFAIHDDEGALKEKLNDLKASGKLFHVKIRTKMGPNQRFIERPYTPLIGTTFDSKNEDGILSVLVKRSIKKNRLCLSHAICTPTVIETAFDFQIKPCMIAMEWYARSSSIGLVCCGTGITPALQILSMEAARSDSAKKLYLVWCNRSDAHASLRPELTDLLTKLKGRFRLTHLFSRSEEILPALIRSKHEFEDFELGRFDEDFLSKNPGALPRPPKPEDESSKVAVLICGTWEFERSVKATMFMSGFSSDALIRIPG